MEEKKVAFHHFGCKVNFAEGSALSRQFVEKGYELTDFHEKADIYVISTCVVTAVAEKKCRAAIRQAHKINPEARIAVIGCFSELKPGEIATMEGVSVVLGHSNKFDLLQEIENHHDSTSYGHHFGGHQTFVPSYSFGDRTRSFLKIQDGCDYYCSYCTIPFARGHSRSDSIENVVKSARKVASDGIKEIILTGVNIGDFGRGTSETFIGLVRRLETESGLPRIRISSIEPDLLSPEIIEIIAKSEKFMPHFHIPLQAGSDEVLKKMKRKYDTALFASRISDIKKAMPHACIACDIIAGFPAETRENFSDTVHFVENLDISYLHVFSYSRRERTLAAGMTDLVTSRERKERSQILHRISEEKKSIFYADNRDRESFVLFESDETNGYMHGFTENYIRVKTLFNPDLINQVVKVKLQEQDTEGVFIFHQNKNDA
ncbi:MAG: tRNA (N(6)-L-threonylcarbamoyladenosine(37)-C(2))-methylthiotransferase MtaB [Syntrophothermus sp.]